MRYALIDAQSGFVWGWADASDAISACRLVDIGLGEFYRNYDDLGPNGRLKGHSGYFVHAVRPNYECLDGQSECEIAAVEARPLVAVVKVTNKIP